MIVMLTSIMRNASGYLDGYFAQVDDLSANLSADGHELLVRVAEGDSTDDTYERLMNVAQNRPNLVVFKFDHNGPAFGSVNNPTRWANIARTWNRLFDAIRDESFDALIYVESDLRWNVGTMRGLLDDLKLVPAVAPMSMHHTGFFYDTWGYRAGGVNFSNSLPYHQALTTLKPDQLMQIDSAGSCKVMRREVATSCRFSEIDAMIGHEIYAKGYSLWLDPDLKVIHP